MRPETVERAREILARAGLGGMSDRAIMALGIGCLLLIAIAGWRLWPAAGSDGGTLVVPGSEAAADVGEGAGQASAAGESAVTSVTVHVVGAVHRPGVYALPEGSRVRDAIDAADGCIGDAMPEAVNLARILVDGEQVRIPTAAEVAAGVAAGGAGAAGAASGAGVQSGQAGGKININSASVGELDALPGVGPSTAQKIVDDRTANGPFKRIEDLMRVSGIGEKKFEALKDSITVG